MVNKNIASAFSVDFTESNSFFLCKTEFAIIFGLITEIYLSQGRSSLLR